MFVSNYAFALCPSIPTVTNKKRILQWLSFKTTLFAETNATERGKNL